MRDFRHISNIFPDVLARLNQSKQRGNELWCHCPFHVDRYPSFSVNLESGAWYCFACAEGGSIYQLVTRLGIETDKLNLKPTTKTTQPSVWQSAMRIAEAFDTVEDQYLEDYRIKRNRIESDWNEGRISEAEYYFKRQLLNYEFDCYMEIHDENRNRLNYEAKLGVDNE